LNISQAKTKILCTLGPASSSKKILKALISKGIDGVRLNFSHGTYDFFRETFENIEAACSEENTSLSVLLDLQGPKIRVGEIAGDGIELTAGNKIDIVTEYIQGTAERISTSYKLMVHDAAAGDMILINDGLIKLVVIEKKENSLTCQILEGGKLTRHKGINLPGMKISTPALTEKDIRDIDFASGFHIDYVALSFVRSANDIMLLKNLLKKKNLDYPIIAKIEKREAIESFDEILAAADGIMIARGDLGVELLPQEVPVIQKQIISKCNAAGKLVITATQMLESMIVNPVPTRAEASDVANAVWDGTDVVMLSGETSVGSYPVETVQIMNDILIKTENSPNFQKNILYEIPFTREDNLLDSTGRAVCAISEQINSPAIVVFTASGKEAHVISKYRPKAKILAISNNPGTVTALNLCRGVIPFYIKEIEDEEKAIEASTNLIVENLIAKKGDTVIYTTGIPFTGDKKFWLRFATI
jgi:pyruvate kinase